MAKRSRRVFRINNMTGLMNTMAEDNAYLTIDPNANYGVGINQTPFEFKRVENWMPINRGGLSKTFGFSLHKNVGSSTPITGLYRYIKSDGNRYFLVSYGNTVYKLVGSTLTSLSMTVSNNAYLHFETAYDECVVCDGSNSPQTFDGTTVANLTSGSDATALNGARQAIFYQNRLMLFSSTHDQSLVYYSDPGDISAGYASNFINCDVNDGQKITGIAKFFIPGELQPVLIVGKERSVGIIIGDGTLTNPYTFLKISQDLGIPGFRQIVQFKQDAAFLTPRGVSSYQTSLDNINIEQRFLSRNVSNQFTSLLPTYLPDALAWFDWKNRRVSFAVASGSSQYPNQIWHYDIELGGFYLQSGFTVTSAMVDTDGVVYTGSSTGKIYKHDPNVNSYDGLPILANLQTPYLDFFEPHYLKRIVNGRIVARGAGNYDLGLSSTINNGTGQGSSHTIRLISGSYSWGEGTWNESSSYQWGSAPLIRDKVFPGEIFENISFNFTQTGINQPIDLLEMILEVEYLNTI